MPKAKPPVEIVELMPGEVVEWPTPIKTTDKVKVADWCGTAAGYWRCITHKRKSYDRKLLLRHINTGGRHEIDWFCEMHQRPESRHLPK
jgi:hypothetical protein